MLTKNQQLISYLVSVHPRSSITSLIKLAYLIDLVSLKISNRKISEYNYIRYYYGPYDESISDDLRILVEKEIIIPKTEYTQNGTEYIIYDLNDEAEFSLSDISREEKEIIDNFTESVKGYGAKMLTDLAYKTKPMLSFGATQGGREHFSEPLNLNV